MAFRVTKQDNRAATALDPSPAPGPGVLCLYEVTSSRLSTISPSRPPSSPSTPPSKPLGPANTAKASPSSPTSPQTRRALRPRDQRADSLGGSRYTRRDAQGRFPSDQSDVGRRPLAGCRSTPPRQAP